MVNSASVLGVIRAWLQNNKLRVVWYVAVQARKHSVSCLAAVAGVDNRISLPLLRRIASSCAGYASDSLTPSPAV
jgi:hypothetical protein